MGQCTCALIWCKKLMHTIHIKEEKTFFELQTLIQKKCKILPDISVSCKSEADNITMLQKVCVFR